MLERPPLSASDVSDALARARLAWPALKLEDSVFVEYLRERLPEQPTADDLATLRVEDLYLACGCATRVPGAHALLEQHLLRDALSVVSGSGSAIDKADFGQRLREHLLLATPGKPARIASYSGRGRLASWIGITAQRLLVDLLREMGRAPAVASIGEETAIMADDAEVSLLKDSFREDFQAAFEAAFGRLSPRQRTLLRYRYLDQLDIAAIATLMGRHRVNISKALTRAREDLLLHLRRELVESFRVASSEVESVIRLLHSQLQVSLGRLLAPSGAHGMSSGA